MSQTIKWSKIKDLVKLYEGHPNRLKTIVNGSPKTLNGWRVPNSVISDLLNQQGEDIKEIFVIPMVKPSDENNPQVDQFFTIALAGINDQNEIISTLAYDFTQVCPSVCPQNFRQLIDS